MKVKKLLTAICAAGLLSPLGSAQAQIVIDDWTLNLSDPAFGAGNFLGGYGVVTDIKQMSFNALYHFFATSAGWTGTTAGDTGLIDVYGKVNSLQDTLGLGIVATSTGEVYGASWEITFKARADEVVTGFALGVSSFTHAGNGSANCAGACILDVYLDTTFTAGVLGTLDYPGLAVPAGGTGMGGPGVEPVTDPGAILVASFELLAGNGGTFSLDPSKLDGADDSTWKLLFNYAFGGDCVLEDSTGACLALGSTLGIVNSTTDADEDNNGLADTTIAAGPLAGTCGLTVADNCGVEEGKFQLAIPEPGTVALLGVALAGLGAMRRRRQGSGGSATA